MKNRLLYTLCFSVLTGQLTAIAQNNDTDDEPVFELSPFVVETSDQDGYLATNSNSGTRLSQNIKDLPMPVEIITGEFIEDIGALDVQEALEFSAGLETEITSVQVGENTTNPNAFRLRGFVSEAVMRSGFKVIGATDSINISQVDVVRGPNALLYGIGNFGGVVNYITARPTSEFRAKASVTYGSYNFLRWDTQVKGPITDKLGYTLGISSQEGDGWADHAWSEKKGISGLLEYRLTEQTTVTLEADYIYQDNQSPENPLGPNFVGFVNEGEELIDPGPFPQVVLDVFGDNIYEDPDSRRGFLRYPRNDFRYSGLDTFNEVKDTSVTLSLTHNFSENLSLQVGANYVKRDRFQQGVSVSYSKNLGNILSDTSDGEIKRQLYPWMYLPQHPDYDAYTTPEFQALEYGWSRGENIEEREQLRAEMMYQKDLLGFENTFIAGVTYNKFLPNQGAGYDLKDLAREGQPIRIGDLSGLQSARDRFQSVYNYTPIRFEPSETEEWVQTTPFVEPSKFWERGYYFIHQGKFFDNKVNTVTGIRYDSIDTANGVRWDFEDEGFTQDKLATMRTYNHRADGPSTDVNTSIGVSYAPTDEFSIFVLRASALQPIYNQTNPTGYIMEPQKGLSYELGIKFDVMDRKISGAVSFYEIEREGVPVRTGAETYPRDNRNNPNGDDDWFAQGRNTSNDFGNKEDTSRGVDMQVFFTNILQGLQTVVNFSYNDYEWVSLTGPSFVRKEGQGEDAEFIFETVDKSDTINPNRKFNDTPEYSVRIWNKYTFDEGAFDGLSLGLGFNWTDEREASFGSFDRVSSRESLKIIPSRTEWSALISYSTEIRDTSTSVRLNLYNLLDDTGVAGYSYLTGRRFRLSLNVNF